MKNNNNFYIYTVFVVVVGVVVVVKKNNTWLNHIRFLLIYPPSPLKPLSKRKT